MTLKYESEILFDLMKRDGDVAPSDVLPYESELKEKYLNQVEGAYPKLQDYRSEWMNYNLNGRLPADFPVESVSNVTNASFHDVVPYTYKSAILKGSTKYRDIDTGDILDTFDETKNLELVSVKMPVLTTTGKNLFDGKMEIGSIDNKGDVYVNVNHKRCVNFIPVKGNTTYTISREKAYDGYLIVHQYDENKNFIKYNAVGVYQKGIFTTDSNTRFVKFRYEKVDDNNFQIEEGSVATTYEPFKSNILSISEDLELRGIGDVKDELDLVSGKLTQRIGEIVLDGSEHWLIYGEHFYTTNSIANHSPKCMGSWLNGVSNMTQIGVMCDKGVIRINLNNINDDIQVLKNTLSQNPLILHYELKTPTIKTVDLICINEQDESATFRPIEGTMHVNTSSQALPPLLDMSVPVEATTQNLMSFANIVEEEY